MAIIKKKIWPEFFEKVLSGTKKFELRLADFAVAENDTLVLMEWNPATKKYTGRTIEKRVGSVLKFDLNTFGQKEEIEKHGLYVISLD
ncbi:MAG: Uncharacterized protein G01um101472_563 [Parcubacteria group bacterium Gr01-1014_72]|nr:MAG: Uncharacterized protein G01um101472_563 [Parcubacteria group bacterium Gr01-1014_72]